MSTSRPCDASPLTDGEIHLLSERHPQLGGFPTGIVLGTDNQIMTEMIEALLAAFPDGADSRFGLATLTAGERVLVSERRPEFSTHAVDLVAATNDATVARIMDAAVALADGAQPAARPARKPAEAPAKQAAKRDTDAAPEAKSGAATEKPDEDDAPIHPAVLAASAKSHASGSNGSDDRAPWADRLRG